MSFNFVPPGLKEATGAIRDLDQTLKELKATLRDLSGSAYFLTMGLGNLLDGLASKGTAAAGGINSLREAANNVRGANTMPSPSGSNTGMSGAGSFNASVASAGASIAAAGGGGGGFTGMSSPPGGMDIVQSMGIGTSGKGFFQDILMMPLRYMRDTITANRQTALNTAGALSMSAFATGTPSQNMMTQLARFPGSIMGSTSDLLNLFANTPQYGAMYGFGGANAPRTPGFLAGVRQMQMLNPSAPVAELTGTLGGFAGNTQAQQVSQMMTGGAFGMIKPGGGGQKSLSEWAESILRWLEGLRGGTRKPFDYGELMAQYFPGSNIDAWFEVNGVPQSMRDYWWTYALGKAKNTGTTGGSGFAITPESSNVAWQRLAATSSLTRNEFGLAGVMAGAYANKEVSNRWLNDLVGQFQMQTIPAAVSKGVLNFMQYMPDTIEQMLMAALERSGMFGSVLGALIGYPGIGSGVQTNPGITALVPGMGLVGAASSALSGDWGGAASNAAYGLVPGLGLGRQAWNMAFGDVGDIGDYGPFGGTGTAGLHPDMKRKVGAMMRANPRLRMTSGLRDTAMQRRLKERGLGRVSGKPSSHTRGLAADLGPRSEYGWISANANKFGLKSGASKGEPWHVGIGDIEQTDPNELFGFAGSSEGKGGGGLFDVLSGFIQMIQGGGGEASISGLGKIVPSMLNILRGAMVGGKEYDASALTFLGQELYDRLYQETKTIRTGGIMGTLNRAITGAQDYVSDIYSTATGRTTLESFFGQVLSQLGAPVTRNNMLKLAAIAKVEGNNSGTFNPFNRTGGPGTNFNSVGVKNYPDWDTGVLWSSKLLTQSNTAAMRSNVMTDASYDQFIDATAAFYTSWGGTHGARLLNQIGPDRAGEMLTHAVGAGDVEDYSSITMPTLRSGATSVIFRNTFNIQGGGGGTGIDMRRTVTTMADHLEEEMRRRVTRYN